MNQYTQAALDNLKKIVEDEDRDSGARIAAADTILRHCRNTEDDSF